MMVELSGSIKPILMCAYLRHHQIHHPKTCKKYVKTKINSRYVYPLLPHQIPSRYLRWQGSSLLKLSFFVEALVFPKWVFVSTLQAVVKIKRCEEDPSLLTEFLFSSRGPKGGKKTTYVQFKIVWIPNWLNLNDVLLKITRTTICVNYISITPDGVDSQPSSPIVVSCVD